MTRQLNSFQGPLEKDQLFSLLGYLKSSLSTGKLEVEAVNGECGSIFLEAGKVVHAECGRLTGKFAMIRLTTMGEGRFDFTVGDASPHSTIVESLENLAISVAVAVDEARLTGEVMMAEAEPQLDLDGPLELLTPPANLSVTLEMDMLGLLPLVKAKTTLRSINQTLRWPESRLLSVAATLVRNGMLRVGAAPTATVDPAFVQALRQDHPLRRTRSQHRLDEHRQTPRDQCRIAARIIARIIARIALHRFLTRPGRSDQRNERQK